jgi:hypothetical protein
MQGASTALLLSTGSTVTSSTRESRKHGQYNKFGHTFDYSGFCLYPDADAAQPETGTPVGCWGTKRHQIPQLLYVKQFSCNG